jgi:putative dehydrogenase
MNTVGLIGVGAMGLAMARNLHARGHRVYTRDVRPQADAEARAFGLVVCASPRALAEQTEVVVVVVVNAQQIDAVLFGADGVVQAQGGARTVVLCSTR